MIIRKKITGVRNMTLVEKTNIYGELLLKI